MFTPDRNPWRGFLRRVCGARSVGSEWSIAKSAVLICGGIVLVSVGIGAAERAPALSPKEALKSFQIEAGLKIELVAAEPVVVAPVAYAFDERGRLYVVENRGYPDPIDGKAAPAIGRVALLEDTDGDGRYDKRTEFATGLTYPNGIMVWRGGVFVTCAPDIFYLKDTDGDGVADVKKVVLTGFDTSKSTQLRTSHPTLGPDGKVYVTCGLTGGKVMSPEHPERAAVTFSPTDGRFDPDTLGYETTGGRGQFGLTFDSFGRRFVCSNRHPVLQVMLEPWQLKRNPDFAFAETTQTVSKVEAEARVWPISGAAVTADFIPNLMHAPHSGTFTSACGVYVFTGDALTPAHDGNVFICEPAQNLVQRQILRANGAALAADPAEGGKEFLASTDPWFRPVFLGGGPDGALYVVDMHRKEIDHPVYVPAESRGLLDFESGKDRGRIYRITRTDTKVARSARPPTNTQLAAALLSTNGWQREQARQRLIEAGPGEARNAVEAVVVRSGRAEGRVAALETLAAWRGLSAKLIGAALKDQDGRVREVAVRLADEMVATAPELLAPLIAAAGDAEPRVRFEAAIALGSVADAKALGALAAIGMRDGEDRWTRAAVLSGIGGRAAEFQAALRDAPAGSAAARGALLRELGKLIGTAGEVAAGKAFLAQLLTGGEGMAWRVPAVLGLAEGLATGGGKGARKESLATLGGNGWDAFLATTAAQAQDAGAETPERAMAVALIGYAKYETAAPVLAKLLDARQPPEVQLAAVRAIERLVDARGAGLLTARTTWGQFSPAVREAAIAALMSRPVMIAGLFAAIEGGAIAAGELSAVRRTQLMKHADASVRARAATVFKALEGGDRMAVYQSYRDCLTLTGDAARGREVFLKVCSACHTVRGAGGKVGPDLTGLRNQPAAAILLHILVPNYEVAPAFQAMTVTGRDGRSATGWLLAESETGVTLRTAAGTEETMLRREIATLVASGVSLMPDGLEAAVDRAAMADLIAFLKAGQ